MLALKRPLPACWQDGNVSFIGIGSASTAAVSDHGVVNHAVRSVEGLRHCRGSANDCDAELLDKCIGSQIWVVMKTGQLASLVRDAELDAEPSVYRARVRRETAGL